MVKEQLETMKADVDNRTVTFNTELTKFSARWSELKPSKAAVQDREAALATLFSMKETRNELEELKEASNKIVSDCASFDMMPPSFPALETIGEEIKRYEESWSFYESFTTEVTNFGRKLAHFP